MAWLRLSLAEAETENPHKVLNIEKLFASAFIFYYSFLRNDVSLVLCALEKC